MRRQNTIQDFWNKVKKTEQCWEWLDSKSPSGYGNFTVNGKNVTSHRFSYELINGEIPKNLTLDHLCRNRACVNPNHLEVVTHKENILRGEGLTAINARKTHCIRGHELNEENIYIDKSGKQCKICCKEYAKKYYPLHRKKIKEIKKKYYQKNKLRISEQKKQYRKKNKALIKKQQKRSYQKRIALIKKIKGGRI